MFGKLFGSKQKPAPASEESQLDQKTQALIHAIRERSKEDPLVGAKIGAKEIYTRLIDVLKKENGVHVESLLHILGALAGYACQANLRAQALAKGLPPNSPFMLVQSKDGGTYFFGDPLNNALAGAQYSIWSLAGGAAQHAGAKELPDLEELFSHVTGTVGTPEFGVPRLPEKHRVGDTPANFLKALWPRFLPTVKLYCPSPVHWPILYGLAIQHAIEDGKAAISPEMAFRIVMECAIPMSKVDIERL